MLDRLIENWLINVHELGYQIPFCEVLLTQGFTVLHVSKHGRGEHGKDVIARHQDGRLFAFQLKGGNIALSDWHAIRGEVEELVRLPVSTTLPTLTTEEHTPVLVTNGELRGDAPTSIKAFADTWSKAGSEQLEVWQKHQLLRMFIDAHGSYLPVELREFREFVELYVFEFNERLPREKLAQFLAKVVAPNVASGKRRSTKRAIESMVLLGSYLVEPYERAQNHVAAAEGWTIVASTILHVAQREDLAAKYYEQSLMLVWTALINNLSRLRREVFDRKHFVEPNYIFAETDIIRGVRTVLSLGWLTAESFIRTQQTGLDTELKNLVEIVKDNLSKLGICSEADWPAIVTLALFVERNINSASGEALICNWVRAVVSADRNKELGGLPSPYWLQERALALRYSQLPPHEKERFEEHSYTILSALDMLVRRMRRQFVATYWRDASRLTFSNFVPDSHAEWFLWKSPHGELQLVVSQQPARWTEWTRRVARVQRSSVPQLLLAHAEWLLPFFLTFPHRMNREACAAVDAVIGLRADLN